MHFPLFDLEFQTMTLTRFSKAGRAAHAMNERTANLLHSQHGVDWSESTANYVLPLRSAGIYRLTQRPLVRPEVA